MSAPITTASACANCGHRLSPWDHFCSHCGQDTKNHPPSLLEFAHEWALHYVALEGKLWKSLWALLLRPGFLTAEYLAGRKQRYVLPLRLLLTFGLLFFFALKFSPELTAAALQTAPSAQQAAEAQAGLDQAGRQGMPPEAVEALRELMPAAPASGASAAPAAASRSAEPLQIDAETVEHLPTWVNAPLKRAQQRFSANREAALEQLKSSMLSLAPYAVLLSLPLFAGLLKLLYPRTVYGAHFLFAMHLHAAWYLMLLLAVLLPAWGPLFLLLWLWSNAYPLLALRRVHRSGWASTLGRAALLAVLHWAVLVLLFAGLLAAGIAAFH